MCRNHMWYLKDKEGKRSQTEDGGALLEANSLLLKTGAKSLGAMKTTSLPPSTPADHQEDPQG